MQNVDHDVGTPANKKYNVHKDHTDSGIHDIWMRRYLDMHDIWNFAVLG